MPILAVGDLHFREALSYSEYISDKRIEERERVLDTIVEASKDCSAVVFMGDQLNSRTNHADTLKRFVAFLERFGSKELFLLGGNHDKWADGRSALDFLGEIKGKNWHVIAKGPELHVINGKRCVLLPYMSGPEVHKSPDSSWEEVSRALISELPSGDFLFAHHAVEETIPWAMEEVMLLKEDTLKKFSNIIVGHIHESGFFHNGRVLLTGSSFTDSMGEHSKFTFKIPDEPWTDESACTRVALPVRPMYKVDSSNLNELDSVPDRAIVKVVISSKDVNEDEILKKLQRFDGSVITSQISEERKRDLQEIDLRSISVEGLLEAYAKSRGIEIEVIREGFNLIK